MMFRLFGLFLRRFLRFQNLQLSKVVWLTLAVTAYAASGFMYFEQLDRPDLTWSDALWWAVVTMTTVGYGDFFPESFGGRYLVAFPTMLVGISILGYVLSAFAQSLLEAYSRGIRGMAKLQLKDHVLIIHYPGESRVLAVLEELLLDEKTRDLPIVLVDEHLPELPDALKARELRFVHGDPALVSTLERADVAHASLAIVLAMEPLDPHSDNHTLAATVTIDHLHADIHCVVECVDPQRVQLMRRAGADSVVCLAQLSSTLLVQEAVDPGALSVLHQMTSNQLGEQLYMVELKSSKACSFADAASKLSAQSMLAIGVKQSGDVVLNPDGSRPVQPGEHLVCIGKQRLTSIQVG